MTTTVLPCVSQLVQHLEHSFATSWKCKPVVGSSRIYNVRPVARRFDSSLDEFDALRLAARQRRRLLADVDVAEADALPASSKVVANATAPP